MHLKNNLLTKPLSHTLTIGVLIGTLLIPTTVFAFGFGPFTLFGGEIIGTEDIIGLTHQVFIIKDWDNSKILVMATGSMIAGLSGGSITPGGVLCPIGGSIKGFGIQIGPFIQNIFSGCVPAPS